MPANTTTSTTRTRKFISLNNMIKHITNYTPTLKGCWILFFCVTVCGSLLSYPANILKGYPIVSTLLSYIILFIPAITFAYFKGKSTDQRPRYKINAPSWGKLHPAILFMMLPFILAAFIVVCEPINSIITTPEWFDNIMKDTVSGESPVISFITTCICAATIEEFLCRGLMLRGLLENKYPPFKAILWSSFFFAILHLNPWQALPAFLFGLLFGWLYYKTRCIWIPISLHFLNNTASFVIYRLFPDLPASVTIRDLVDNSQTYFAIFALAIGVLSIAFFIISKFVIKRNENEQEAVISA